MSKLYDLLSSIIAKVKKTEAAIPKKVSELENDLPRPDWNQSDETAPDYIKNRPFYKEYTIETKLVPTNVVYEETNICTDAGDSLGRSYTINKNFLVEGNMYAINWNGTEYIDIACCKNSNGTLYVGSDPAVGADYSVLPFLMYADSSEATIVNVRHNSNDSDLVSQLTVTEYGEIEVDVEVAHKIDPKYLPDEALVKPDWNQNDETAPDFIKNRPFYDNTQKVEVNEECNVGGYWCSGNVALGELLKSEYDLSNLTVMIENVEYALEFDANYGWKIVDPPAGIESEFMFNNYDGSAYLVYSSVPDGQVRTIATVSGYYEISDVKKIDPKCLPTATAVADVTSSPTAAEFNALLTALREAGYLAT